MLYREQNVKVMLKLSLGIGRFIYFKNCVQKI